MKQRFILAVERKNLTEQDEIRLLDLDGTVFGADSLFKQALKAALQDRNGKVKITMGTFAEWVRYARNNLGFDVENHAIIQIELDYYLNS